MKQSPLCVDTIALPDGLPYLRFKHQSSPQYCACHTILPNGMAISFAELGNDELVKEVQLITRYRDNCVKKGYDVIVNICQEKLNFIKGEQESRSSCKEKFTTSTKVIDKTNQYYDKLQTIRTNNLKAGISFTNFLNDFLVIKVLSFFTDTLKDQFLTLELQLEIDPNTSYKNAKLSDIRYFDIKSKSIEIVARVGFRIKVLNIDKNYMNTWLSGDNVKFLNSVYKDPLVKEAIWEYMLCRKDFFWVRKEKNQLMNLI